jgi:glutathionyl-hydroquinone reductase
VELYRETFNPIVEILPDSLKKEADLTGRFVFPPISNGVYNIYSTYDSADFFTRALFITSIRVPSDTVLEQRYFSPGKFEVVLIKESQAPFTATVVSAQFYLKGSPFYSLQDLVSTDHYTFDDVPIAKYNCDIRIIASMGSRYVKFEYPDSVEVKNALGGPPNGDQVIIYAKSDTMEAVPHSLYKQ